MLFNDIQVSERWYGRGKRFVDLIIEACLVSLKFFKL